MIVHMIGHVWRCLRVGVCPDACVFTCMWLWSRVRVCFCMRPQAQRQSVCATVRARAFSLACVLLSVPEQLQRVCACVLLSVQERLDGVCATVRARAVAQGCVRGFALGWRAVHSSLRRHPLSAPS